MHVIAAKSVLHIKSHQSEREKTRQHKRQTDMSNSDLMNAKFQQAKQEYQQHQQQKTVQDRMEKRNYSVSLREKLSNMKGDGDIINVETVG